MKSDEYYDRRDKVVILSAVFGIAAVVFSPIIFEKPTTWQAACNDASGVIVGEISTKNKNPAKSEAVLVSTKAGVLSFNTNNCSFKLQP